LLTWTSYQTKDEMTEKQRKQWEVQQAVAAVMTQYRSKWETVPELSKEFGDFSANLEKIRALLSDMDTDTATLKENRNLARKELIEKVFPVASVMGVYAYDTGNRKLSRLASVKYSELEKLGASRLLKYAGMVRKAAGKLMDGKDTKKKKPEGRNVSDYGLTAGHVERLETAREQFADSEKMLTEARQDKRKSKAQLEKKLRSNKQLMKKRMDRMVQLFREDQKRFYQAYSRARIAAVNSSDTVVQESPVRKPAAKKPAAAKTTGRKPEPKGEEAPGSRSGSG